MDELRQSISEILVKWNMPTRQVAINEIMALIDSYSREARIDELQTLTTKHSRTYKQTVTDSSGGVYVDDSHSYISKYETQDRIAELKALGGKVANHE